MTIGARPFGRTGLQLAVVNIAHVGVLVVASYIALAHPILMKFFRVCPRGNKCLHQSFGNSYFIPIRVASRMRPACRIASTRLSLAGVRGWSWRRINPIGSSVLANGMGK